MKRTNKRTHTLTHNTTRALQVRYYRLRVEQLDQVIEKQRQHGLPASCNAFVFLKSPLSVVAAQRIPFTQDPVIFRMCLAPDYDDICWNNLYLTTRQRKWRQSIGVAMVVLLFLLYAVPVGWVASLLSYQSLKKMGVNLSSSAATSVLSSASMTGFVMLLPQILDWIVRFEGEEAWSWNERRVLLYFFIFIVLHFFFLVAIGGSVLDIVRSVIAQPDLEELAKMLGRDFSGYAVHFSNFVAMQAFVAFPLKLLNLPVALVMAFRRWFARTDREAKEAYKPWALNYGSSYPYDLLPFIIGVSYSSISSFVLWFVAFFYAVGYFVVKYRMLYVCLPNYESGGLCWPGLVNRMVFGLLCKDFTLLGDHMYLSTACISRVLSVRSV